MLFQRSLCQMYQLFQIVWTQVTQTIDMFQLLLLPSKISTGFYRLWDIGDDLEDWG